MSAANKAPPAPPPPPPKHDHLANALAAWNKVGELMKANPKWQVPY